MLNLPNFLTLIRIIAIPFFLVLLASHLYLDALAVFIIGGLTDALDGAVARVMNQKTSLGAYLDPLADKLLVISSFVMLGMIGGLPLWLVVLVVSRDVIILFGYGMLYFLVGDRPKVQPTWLGKTSTFFQLFTVGFALVVLHDPKLLYLGVHDALVFVTSLTTVLSGLQYVYRGLVWLQNELQIPSRSG
jgi:cardiolipin synthase